MKNIEYIVNEKDCHICISHHKDKWGYPTIKRNHKTLKISRYFWEQKNGIIPNGLFVLHRCDNPACINVEHFFLGTTDDNMNDMKEKNRQAKGEKNGSDKLTEEQVLQIRQETGRQIDIAEKYGVSKTLVSYIKNRRLWKWL